MLLSTESVTQEGRSKWVSPPSRASGLAPGGSGDLIEPRAFKEGSAGSSCGCCQPRDPCRDHLGRSGGLTLPLAGVRNHRLCLLRLERKLSVSEAARGLLTPFAAWTSEAPGVSVKLQISGHHPHGSGLGCLGQSTP